MKGSYRFKRQACHGGTDVSVSVECERSDAEHVTLVESVVAALPPPACEGVLIGAARASEREGPLEIRVLEVVDHSGVTSQLGFAFAAEAAVFIAIGKPELAPSLFPGMVTNS